MLTRSELRTLGSHPWRIAALVGAIGNVAFNLMNGRGSSPSVAEVSNKFPTLFTPAGYAFAIWGVIYAATIVYGVLSLLPSQLGVRFHDRVAPWLLMTNALASLWVALFSAEHLGPSVLIILAMLTCAAVMFTMASDHLVDEHLSHWWRAPFGLWLGWLSVATLANVNVALSAAGWSGFPLPAAPWTALLLAAAGVIAVAVGVLFLDPVVPLVVSWSATAIAVEQWSHSRLVVVVSVLVAAKALILSARMLTFTRLPLPKPEREGIERALRLVPKS